MLSWGWLLVLFSCMRKIIMKLWNTLMLEELWICKPFLFFFLLEWSKVMFSYAQRLLLGFEFLGMRWTSRYSLRCTDQIMLRSSLELCNNMTKTTLSLNLQPLGLTLQWYNDKIYNLVFGLLYKESVFFFVY